MGGGLCPPATHRVHAMGNISYHHCRMHQTGRGNLEFWTMHRATNFALLFGQRLIYQQHPNLVRGGWILVARPAPGQCLGPLGHTNKFMFHRGQHNQFTTSSRFPIGTYCAKLPHIVGYMRDIIIGGDGSNLVHQSRQVTSNNTALRLVQLYQWSRFRN